MGLLGLTIVPSKEHFNVHKVFFVTFALSGLTYFVLTCFLWKNCGIYQETNIEKISFDEKMFWLKLYIVLGIAMSILYYWHNKHCPKYDLANISILLPSKKIGQFSPLHTS